MDNSVWERGHATARSCEEGGIDARWFFPRLLSHVVPRVCHGLCIAVVAVILTCMMGARAVRTGALMPAGAVAALSAPMALLFARRYQALPSLKDN